MTALAESNRGVLRNRTPRLGQALRPPVVKVDHVIVFLLPLTHLIYLNIGGMVFGQDVIAIPLLFLLLPKPGSFRQLAQAKVLFILAGLWLFGLIVTDLYRETPADQILKGWGRTGFFILQLAVMWLYVGPRPALFAPLALGMGVALILHVYELPPGYADVAWKFGVADGLALIVAAIGSFAQKRGKARAWTLSAFFLAVVAALALVNGARNAFGTTMLAAAYMALASFVAARPRAMHWITPGKFVFIILAGLLVAQGLLGAYSQLAASGALGNDARLKYEFQASSKLSLLQGGRLESLVSVAAVRDSPLLGHGSWAKDRYYGRLLDQKLFEAGIKTPPLEFDEIPSHSYLFLAWVEAGVTGAIFWIWALILIVIGLYATLKSSRFPSPVIVVSAFSLLWNIPFSPFGAEVRFQAAAQLVFILAVVLANRRQTGKRTFVAHRRITLMPSISGPPFSPRGTMARPISARLAAPR